MSADSRCGDVVDHGRHEWYWRSIFRRDCPGVLTQACDPATGGPHAAVAHGPHWHAARPGVLCRGTGLAAICAHGEQAPNACRACSDTQG